MDAEVITLDETGQVNTESPFSWVGDFVVPYVFSILFVITLFTSSGFLLQGVSEEKEGRIIEILLSSISATQLLAGKILGLGAVGLIQVFVWFGAGVALLQPGRRPVRRHRPDHHWPGDGVVGHWSTLCSVTCSLPR